MVVLSNDAGCPLMPIQSIGPAAALEKLQFCRIFEETLANLNYSHSYYGVLSVGYPKFH
jgi:hypothetical protein